MKYKTKDELTDLDVHYSVGDIVKSRMKKDDDLWRVIFHKVKEVKMHGKHLHMWSQWDLAGMAKCFILASPEEIDIYKKKDLNSGYIFDDVDCDHCSFPEIDNYNELLLDKCFCCGKGTKAIFSYEAREKGNQYEKFRVD